MARKLRVEYPGALYHVVNRGNYRHDVFASAGAAQAWVKVLEEAVQIYGWQCHAYVVMRNHYHLVLATPLPNLGAGMHWLQSTLATRFNRLRGERGHLFQGRYHAGLIEDQRYLGHVVDYVHLNPVRAGVVAVEQAAQFRWSSLGRFVRGPRFQGLQAGEWLACRGLEDSAEGWTRYQAHLVELAGNLAEQERLGWKGFSHGWALGSEEWCRTMAKEQAHRAAQPGLEAGAIRDLREAQWAELLRGALAAQGRSMEELAAERKGAEWKLALAEELRSQGGASWVWLSEHLHLGTPASARSLLSLRKRSAI
ncbi:MAG: transposase [Opitutae bacterium]|nr:transposase [Opitutae bacterium]